VAARVVKLNMVPDIVPVS